MADDDLARRSPDYPPDLDIPAMRGLVAACMR